MNLLEKNTSFSEGEDLTVVVIPASDSSSFAVNIGECSDTVGLHFNPRMADGVVVLNSMYEGDWEEEQRENKCPFQAGVENKIVFSYDSVEFTITLPDGTVMHFPNRLEDDEFFHVGFEGDGKVASLNINVLR